MKYNSHLQNITEDFKKNKLEEYFKLMNFPRFVDRRDIAKLLNRYEIFKKQLNVHGSILECGVNLGSGLFSWLHFSSILEPYNTSRLIFGFDTFEGFKSLSKTKDDKGIYLSKKKFKKFNDNLLKDNIEKSINIHNSNRPINQINKIYLYKGDVTKTFPKFLKDNPQLMISLLHIDLDIYKPTKKVLELAKKRLVKGSIIAFDDLNAKEGPGETLALIETLGLKKYRIQRNNFDSFLSYIVID